jgi:hypothetical protein
MQIKRIHLIALTILAQLAVFGLTSSTWAQDLSTPYPAMAPLDQYLISDRKTEMALARSAAPRSISDRAEVLVLGREGYTSAAKGSNGFVCLVERSWGAATDAAEFWNPKIQSPICVNAPAARTYLPTVMIKTKLVLAGTTKAEIAQAISSAFERKELPTLEPGAMCYMMSRQQYLNDEGKGWHPHMMWFIPGDAAETWGANLPGSPALAANVPEDRMTIFMLRVGHWSDGTPVTPGRAYHAMN